MPQNGSGEEYLASVVLPVGAGDCPFAAGAATWLSRFYSDASATIADANVLLASETLTDVQLEQLWRVALLNERTHLTHVKERRRLMVELTG